jgi:hypothetical protein
MRWIPQELIGQFHSILCRADRCNDATMQRVTDALHRVHLYRLPSGNAIG